MQETQVSHRKSISGRLFTGLFLVLLVLVFFGGLPVILRFETIQNRLADVRESWPFAADALRLPYESIDATLAEDESIPDEVKSRWQEVKRRFGQSPLHEVQILGALEVESFVRDSLTQFESVKRGAWQKSRPQALEDSKLQDFIEKEELLAKAEDDWLGVITRTLLRLHETPRLAPSLEKTDKEMP